MRRVAALLLATAGLLSFAAPAVADESLGRVAVRSKDGFEHAITIRATWGPKGGAVPGWSFVRVTLESDDGAPHDVRVNVGDWDATVAASRSLRLEPRGRAVVWLPVLPNDNTHLRVFADDAASDVLSVGGPDAPVSVLFVGEPERLAGTAGRAAGGLAAAEGLEEALRAAMTSGTSFTFCSVARVPVDALPPTWTYLTAMSLVVVESGAKGLDDPTVQRTLVQYARAGGVLWVRGATALPAGPLADVVRPAETPAVGTRSGRLDFGKWIVGEDVRSVVATWFAPTSATTARDLPGVLPAELGIDEAIPGLGRVDVRLYFILLVAFAILVGPVTYLVLKRRRRLVAMLWVVPAAGTAFAGAILGYGLLSEGLSTRGVVSSISVLDQRTHEATCVASRTLYAAFSPDRLRLSPDTVLHAPTSLPSRGFNWPAGGSGGYTSYSIRMRMSMSYGGRSEDGFRLDAASGTVSGPVFPSRTVTPFSTASIARARERLRFKARPGGGYDVIAAEGFAPVAEPGAIVLRTAKGELYMNDAPAGPLLPTTETQARAALDRLRELTGSRTEPEEDPAPSRFPYEDFTFYGGTTPEAKDRHVWARRSLLADVSPPRAGYVALMTRAPGFDDLGVEVEWKWAHHVVVGLLAPEDVE